MRRRKHTATRFRQKRGTAPDTPSPEETESMKANKIDTQGKQSLPSRADPQRCALLAGPGGFGGFGGLAAAGMGLEGVRGSCKAPMAP